MLDCRPRRRVRPPGVPAAPSLGKLRRRRTFLRQTLVNRTDRRQLTARFRLNRGRAATKRNPDPPKSGGGAGVAPNKKRRTEFGREDGSFRRIIDGEGRRALSVSLQQ